MNMYGKRLRWPAERDNTVFWGYIVVFISFLWFVVMTFNVVGSKFLSPTGNQLLDFLSTDWYYSMLLPMTVVATLVAAYLNWLSMKFFRHN